VEGCSCPARTVAWAVGCLLHGEHPGGDQEPLSCSYEGDRWPSPGCRVESRLEDERGGWVGVICMVSVGRSQAQGRCEGEWQHRAEYREGTKSHPAAQPEVSSGYVPRNGGGQC